MARETEGGAILTAPIGANTLVDAEKTYTWANSAAANTNQSNTFTPPTVLQSSGMYAIQARGLRPENVDTWKVG